MKPFSLTLECDYVTVSQLQQLDLMPYGFEINGDGNFRFDFKLTLMYEHLQEYPELLGLFREKSNLCRKIYRPDVENFLIPLKKLVGSWEQPYSKSYFLGTVPYSPHNLEVFLEYFRN